MAGEKHHLVSMDAEGDLFQRLMAAWIDFVYLGELNHVLAVVFVIGGWRLLVTNNIEIMEYLCFQVPQQRRRSHQRPEDRQFPRPRR